MFEILLMAFALTGIIFLTAAVLVAGLMVGLKIKGDL